MTSLNMTTTTKTRNKHTRKVLHRASSRVEVLEDRRLFAVPTYPVDLVAVDDDTQNFGNTRRSIAFYDVSNVPGSGSNAGYFNQTPLFTITPGYEIVSDRNFEDIAAYDFDKTTGDLYFLAFDNTPRGSDAVGDTGGDYDLYRFNVRAAYYDYAHNNRGKGTIYTMSVAADGFDYIANYGSSYPAVDELSPGVFPGRSNTDGNPNNDVVFLPNFGAKVGEIARAGGAGTTASFNQQQIKVLSPTKILLMENKSVSGATGTIAQDFSLRTIERVSTSPGQATYRAATDDGGFNGSASFPQSQPKESWESFVIDGGAINLDNNDNTATGDLSEVDGMRYVDRDGVQGVWVSERDTGTTGGDDFAFFKLDLTSTTRTATRAQIRNLDGTIGDRFDLPEDPVANPTATSSTPAGEIDFFDLNSSGGLVISESDFSDTAATTPPAPSQPTVFVRPVTSYNAPDSNGDGIPEITFGSWTVYPPVTLPVSDDTALINGNYGVYSAEQNRVYYFDSDSGAAPSVVGDVYVFDLNTGTTTYAELDAANHFYRDANSNVFIRLLPPSVTNVAFSYAGTRQSLAVSFSLDVSASLSAGDFVLTNTTTGATIPSSSIIVGPYDTSTNTVTLTFNNIAGSSSATALPTGNYTLSFAANTVSDAYDSFLLATPSAGSFFFKLADFNGDRSVGFDDLLALAKNYNKSSGATFATGDTDYDGDVDFTDLLTLAKAYNTTLPAASAAATLAADTSTTTTRKSTRATSSVLA